jgi:preprotein translocase subunit SecA
LLQQVGIPCAFGGKLHLFQAGVAAGRDLVRRARLKQNQHTSRVKDWWTHLNTAQGHTTAAAQKRAQIVVYKAWNLWKERCRRVFDNKATDVQLLLASIQDDIQSLHMATDELE